LDAPNNGAPRVRILRRLARIRGSVTPSLAVAERRLASDFFAQIAGRLVLLAFSTASTILLVRMLGGTRYGEWATLAAVIQIVYFTTELGTESVALQRAARDAEGASAWLGALIRLRAKLSLPAVLVAACVFALIAPDHEMLVAGLITSSVLLFSVPIALSVAFMLRLRNDLETALSIISAAAWLGVVIGLRRTNSGLIAVSLGFVGITALTALLHIAWARHFVSLRAGKRPLQRNLIAASLPLGVAFMLVISYWRIDQVLVFELGDSHDASLYGAAFKLLDLALLVPILLLNTLSPVLAAAFPSDLGKVRSVVAWTVDVLLTIAAGALAVSLVSGDAIVRLLYGPSFVAVGDALPVLMLAFVFASLGYLAGRLVVTIGLGRRLLVSAALGLAVNVALNVALIPPFGFMAAAWVTVITEVFILLLIGGPILRSIGLRPRLGRVAKVAAAAGLLVPVLKAIAGTHPPLAAQLLSAAVLYPTLLLLTRAYRPTELLHLLRVTEPSRHYG
jgi:O-antigen/teichoic acid export membrane protein